MDKQKNEEALKKIDEGLEEAAAVTIESALEYAISTGSMDIAEAERCLEAYRRAFVDKID